MSLIQIVVSFRGSARLVTRYPDGTITVPSDAQVMTAFRDPAMVEAFSRYHSTVAELRIVSKSGDGDRTTTAGNSTTGSTLIFL